MIFYQYKETCEALLGYPKIGGEDIKYFVRKFVKNLLCSNIDVRSRMLIAELPGDRVKCISKLHLYCENMIFLKIRYDRLSQQVAHKGGYSAMNYIKRFQNSQALSVSVGNSYSVDQLMRMFLDNFHQGGKYTANIAIQQAELRRERNFTDKKYLPIIPLQTDYLNLDSSSDSDINNERANIVQEKCTLCGGAHHSS